jgi:uncharacterized membrane protein
MKHSLVAHIRRNILRGLFLVSPMLITGWLLIILFSVIDRNVTPLVRQVLVWARVPGLERWIAQLGIPLVGIILTIICVYLLGVLVASLGGRRLIGMFESYLTRIPVIGTVYGSSRQLLDAVNVQDREHFTRVVMFEYPRKGLWTVGFVTREARHELGGPTAESSTLFVPVFLPTTPNPTSGWLIFVPESELIDLKMTVEDGIKLVVSGGIVSPENLGTLTTQQPS